MALQDKPKFSLMELLITAKTRVENVAKSDDFVHDLSMWSVYFELESM